MGELGPNLVLVLPILLSTSRQPLAPIQSYGFRAYISLPLPAGSPSVLLLVSDAVSISECSPKSIRLHTGQPRTRQRFMRFCRRRSSLCRDHLPVRWSLATQSSNLSTPPPNPRPRFVYVFLTCGSCSHFVDSPLRPNLADPPCMRML